MKETINVNIGQRAFTLDCDAHDRLTIYLSELRRNITADTDEVVGDIEIRLAELFTEELSSPMMVVTLAMVERAIARIGRPEDFASEGEGEPTKNYNTMETKRLRRSRTDRSIAGVCGGLANYFGVDATILRIVTLCLILFGGMSLWIYIFMWLLIPEE